MYLASLCMSREPRVEYSFTISFSVDSKTARNVRGCHELEDRRTSDPLWELENIGYSLP